MTKTYKADGTLNKRILKMRQMLWKKATSYCKLALGFFNDSFKDNNHGKNTQQLSRSKRIEEWIR